MKLDTYENPTTQEMTFNATITADDYFFFNEAVKSKLVTEVAEKLADMFIEKYGPDILKAISPEAVANMTIATAGAKINETLNKKIPNSVMHIFTEKKVKEGWF